MLISSSLITTILILFINGIQAQSDDNVKLIATAITTTTTTSPIATSAATKTESSNIPSLSAAAASASSSSAFTIGTTKAQALGLNSTWNAPMPSSIVSPASDFISANWYAKQGFYGADDTVFVQDPFNTNNTTPVLQVNYPAGSYSPIGLQSKGIKGGAEFFSEVEKGKSYNTALLSYDLAFDSTFNWVKGGKLPGIYGGTPSTGCSGGKEATGENCFSVRLMWRDSGAGEAYGYIPTSQALCNSKQVTCNSDYGTSFSRGVIRFSTQKWTHVDIFVKLNTGSNANGILQVWQDGSLMINQQHIQFRSSDSVGISTMMFSTFFGGGSASWATPVNTSTYFKNFQFSAGNTPDPAQGNSAVTLTANSYLATTALFMAVYYFFI